MQKIFEDILKRFNHLSERISRLETWEPYSNEFPINTTNVSNPPTIAELTAALGDPADLTNGYTAIIDDAGAGTTLWLVTAVNGVWAYEQLTLAV